MTVRRTFLAVPLPPLLQDGIHALQGRLAGEIPGIRWTRPETVHLTLHFFGDTRSEDLEKIRVSMLSVNIRKGPFQVDVAGLGAFPDRHRPRVLWLGLSPEEPLRALGRACRDALERHGFATESRAFAPHLTIGRFRERGPDLGSLLDRYAGQRFGELPVERLVLYESRLRPAGAEHLPLFTVPLDGTID